MSYRKHLMTSNEPPSELYKAAGVGTDLASLGTDCISRQEAIDALGERPTVWTTGGERKRIEMRKSVRVIDSSPTANKKGLRIKVESVDLDESNNLLALHIDYSGFHVRGGGVVEVLQRNKFDLPEE